MADTAIGTQLGSVRLLALSGRATILGSEGVLGGRWTGERRDREVAVLEEAIATPYVYRLECASPDSTAKLSRCTDLTLHNRKSIRAASVGASPGRPDSLHRRACNDDSRM